MGRRRNPKYHINYATHVLVFQVARGDTACVKLFKPSVWLCFDWFWLGLRMLSIPHSEPVLDRQRVRELGKMAKDLLADIPKSPTEGTISKLLDGLAHAAEAGEMSE